MQKITYLVSIEREYAEDAALLDRMISFKGFLHETMPNDNIRIVQASLEILPPVLEMKVAKLDRDAISTVRQYRNGNRRIS